MMSIRIHLPDERLAGVAFLAFLAVALFAGVAFLAFLVAAFFTAAFLAGVFFTAPSSSGLRVCIVRAMFSNLLWFER